MPITTYSSREVRKIEARWAVSFMEIDRTGDKVMLATMLRNARRIVETEGLELSQTGQGMLSYYEIEAA